MRPFLALLGPAVALCVAPAAAQTLVLRVTDARTGLPLASASVAARPAAASAATIAPTEGVTGPDGRLRLTLPARGIYDVRIGARAHLPQNRRIEVAGETTVDVALAPIEPGAGEAVFAVTVDAVGRATDASPLTVSRLRAADLDRLPRSQDLALQIASQPSVTAYSESGHGIGYTTLRLRGFDERRLAVTVNGQPMNDPEDHAVYWINVMDLQGAIRDVEVQRGAGTAVYGTTGIGGAINIVADPFAGPARATVEAGAGAFGTRQVAATALVPAGGRVKAFARVSHLASDGYRCHSWARVTRLTGGLQARLGDRQTVRVLGFGGPQEDALAYYGIAKEANARTSADCADDTQRRYNYADVSGDVERFNQPFVTATHAWIVSPSLLVENTAYATRGAGYFDFDATWRTADYLRLPAGSVADRARPLYESAPDASLLFRAYVDNRRAGWLPRAVWTRGTTRTTLGADLLAHGSLHWGRVQETTLPSVPEGESAGRVYSYRGGKTHASVYGSVLARPVARVAVQADLSVRRVRYRLRDEAYFGRSFEVPYTFVNPRVGATLNPDGATRAYASVALAQREARLKNYYDADEAGSGAEPLFARTPGGGFDFGAPLVRPETALNIEVGTSHDAGTWRGGLTGYAYLFRDEIVASGGLDAYGVPRTGNAARTRHLGAEADVTLRLSAATQIDASATVSDDRFVRFDEYDAAGAPVSRDGNRIALFPAASARLGLVHSRRVGRADAGARIGLRAQGVQPTTNAGTGDRSTVLDAHALVDASLWAESRRTAAGRLRLAVDVHNVLDRSVLAGGNSGGFFPAAPRFAVVALRWTFASASPD